jgi:hypothetical protein
MSGRLRIEYEAARLTREFADQAFFHSADSERGDFDLET